MRVLLVLLLLSCLSAALCDTSANLNTFRPRLLANRLSRSLSHRRRFDVGKERVCDSHSCRIVAQQSPPTGPFAVSAQPPSPSAVPISAVIVNALITGSTVLASRLLQSVSAELLFVLKWALSAALLLPQTLQFSGSSEVVLAGLELGLWSALSSLSQFLALSLCSGDKGVTAVCVAALLSPLITGMSERGERKLPSWRRWLAPCLSLCGVALVELSEKARFELQDLALLASPIFFSIYCHRSRQTAVQYPQHAKAITGLLSLVSAIMGCFFTLWRSQFPLTSREWRDIWASLFSDWTQAVPLLFLGLVLTGWSTLSDQEALQTLPAEGLTLVYSLGSVFAILTAHYVLGDAGELGWRAALGGALLVLAASIECSFNS